MNSSTAADVPGWPAFRALTFRELLRFWRQPSRVAAAIGTPLIFLVFFGSGFAHSFAGTGPSYTSYLLPGMISLTVMFSSIFAAISLIEDRDAGFLQSVLVSPAPRWAAVGAKIAGGTIVAAAGFNGLGLGAAWRIHSSQGFHGVMNIVLMPMWLLSGSMFPLSGAAGWLRALMTINPLYWPTAAMREALAGDVHAEPFSAPVIWAAAVAAAAAGVLLAWVGMARVRRRT
jgi:ABC-2 type transport system permease protein